MDTWPPEGPVAAHEPRAVRAAAAGLDDAASLRSGGPGSSPLASTAGSSSLSPASWHEAVHSPGSLMKGDPSLSPVSHHSPSLSDAEAADLASVAGVAGGLHRQPLPLEGRTREVDSSLTSLASLFPTILEAPSIPPLPGIDDFECGLSPSSDGKSQPSSPDSANDVFRDDHHAWSSKTGSHASPPPSTHGARRHSSHRDSTSTYPDVEWSAADGPDIGAAPARRSSLFPGYPSAVDPYAAEQPQWAARSPRLDSHRPRSPGWRQWKPAGYRGSAARPYPYPPHPGARGAYHGPGGMMHHYGEYCHSPHGFDEDTEYQVHQQLFQATGRRKRFDKSQVDVLQYWLINHLEHPYPTDREKMDLSFRTRLQINQINSWFINARRRHLARLRAEQSARNRQSQPHSQRT